MQAHGGFFMTSGHGEGQTKKTPSPYELRGFIERTVCLGRSVARDRPSPYGMRSSCWERVKAVFDEIIVWRGTGPRPTVWAGVLEDRDMARDRRRKVPSLYELGIY